MTIFSWLLWSLCAHYLPLLTWEWCHQRVSKKHINLLCVADWFNFFLLTAATFCPLEWLGANSLWPSSSLWASETSVSGPAPLWVFFSHNYGREAVRNTQPLLWLRLKRLLVTKRETKSAREEKENAQNCTCAEFKQQPESWSRGDAPLSQDKKTTTTIHW